MSSIRKLKNGRYQANYENKFRCIQRTKRTFDTRKEANDWLAAVHQEASARLLGHQKRRVFGEALAKYLREESPKKHKTHDERIEHARMLRWPIWDPETRRWVRIEEAALDETPQVLSKWVADLKLIVRRGYIQPTIEENGRRYHRQFFKRPKGDGTLAWFEQRNPVENERPEPRREVTDPALIAALDRAPGRGPFDSGTLRASANSSWGASCASPGSTGAAPGTCGWSRTSPEKSPWRARAGRARARSTTTSC